MTQRCDCTNTLTADDIERGDGMCQWCEADTHAEPVAAVLAHEWNGARVDQVCRLCGLMPADMLEYHSECPTKKIIIGEDGDSYTLTVGAFDNPGEEEIVLGREIDGYGTVIVGIIIDEDDAVVEWLTSETEPRSYALEPGNRLVMHESFVSSVKYMLID